ncbi:type II toxin-antitoxin system HicA family toxin [Candidatus Uhrbacteria bacterium]|nr:type II toxin-antitoxin system HicA family toxin [Candidatus Uhrbacteria bacterium]
MKRKDLILYLLQNGCTHIREGGRHSVFLNPLYQKTSTVPRHNEIDTFLGKKICPHSTSKCNTFSSHCLRRGLKI